MAFSREGFNNNVFEARKLLSESRDREDDEVLQMLQTLAADSKPSVNIAPQPTTADLVDKPFPMSRTIAMPVGITMDKDALLMLAKLYRQDQILANEMLAKLNDSSYSENDNEQTSEQRKALNRCAIRELLSDSTDVHTQQMELTFISDGARSVRNTALLEEFFDVCQNPNPAEIALLAQVGRTQEEIVREWFTWKRRRVRNLFVARAVTSRQSSAKTALRKRQLEVECMPPRKRKPNTFP